MLAVPLLRLALRWRLQPFLPLWRKEKIPLPLKAGVKKIVVEALANDTLIVDKAANAGGSPLRITDAAEKEATSSGPPSSTPSSSALTKATVFRARLAAIDAMVAGTDAFYAKMLKCYNYLCENVKVQDLS
jgi:hypothetical protein